MSEIPGIGTHDSWFDLFKENFPSFLEDCLKKDIIKDDELQIIRIYFQKMEKYLRDFNNARLLHCDLSINNIRAEKKEDVYIYSGIIDFSDAMSGDPLFDIGEIYEDINFDQEIFQALEEGYGKFSKQEKEVLVFYSLYYSLFLNHKDSILKCIEIFHSLTH